MNGHAIPLRDPVALRRSLGTYLVTDTAHSGDRGVLETIRAAVAGGVTAVQLREKDSGTRELYEVTVAASTVIDGRALLLINDRVDVFLAAVAAGVAVDGVHLGQDDLPAERTRQIIGAGAVLGLTAHTTAHLATVVALPPGTIDYLGVGVIRATSTKADHPPPLGITGFRAFAGVSPLPCIAIGGVGIDDSRPLRDAGAAGLAVASAIGAADDPEREARRFRTAWAEAIG